MEIERKWIVTDFPEEKPRKEYEVETLYLWVSEEMEIRIRRKRKICNGACGAQHGEWKYKLSIKTGNGLVRTEDEFEVSENIWNHVLESIPFPNPIRKHYCKYPLNDGLTLEVSKVDDRWHYAEVEFPDEATANAWKPFEYLRVCGEEVTGDPKYAMKRYWVDTRVPHCEEVED